MPDPVQDCVTVDLPTGRLVLRGIALYFGLRRLIDLAIRGALLMALSIVLGMLGMGAGMMAGM